MEPLHFLYVILVGFGAAFVQRVSGFGLGIFTMMFLPHFMPSHTAAATISCIFSCYCNLLSVCGFASYLAVLFSGVFSMSYACTPFVSNKV
jgi:uncharacterized membrane protein YfcA